MGRSSRAGYIPALDGIRGLVVSGTVYTHYAIFFTFFASGAPHWLLRTAQPFTMNIEMFFALSGALITSLLVKESQRTGDVSLQQFYLRRSRRLGPALVSVVPLLLIANYTVTGSPIPPLGPSPWLTAGSIFVFLGNWRLFFNGDGLGWMGPAWTLGIEEQFYLTWPLLLRACLRRRLSRVPVLVGLSLVVVISVAISSATEIHLGWSRAHYTTPAQLPAILMGCMLGFELTSNPDGLFAKLVRSQLAAVIGIAGVVLVSYYLSADNFVLGHGGYVLYGAAACLLIGHCITMSASSRSNVVTRVLSFRPFIWLGLVSYEAYLIHCVVILALLRYEPRLGLGWMITIDSAIILVLSAALYRIIDQPIRRRGWRDALRLPGGRRAVETPTG